VFSRCRREPESDQNFPFFLFTVARYHPRALSRAQFHQQLLRYHEIESDAERVDEFRRLDLFAPARCQLGCEARHPPSERCPEAGYAAFGVVPFLTLGRWYIAFKMSCYPELLHGFAALCPTAMPQVVAAALAAEARRDPVAADADANPPSADTSDRLRLEPELSGAAGVHSPDRTQLAPSYVQYYIWPAGLVLLRAG